MLRTVSSRFFGFTYGRFQTNAGCSQTAKLLRNGLYFVTASDGRMTAIKLGCNKVCQQHQIVASGDKQIDATQ